MIARMLCGVGLHRFVTIRKTTRGTHVACPRKGCHYHVIFNPNGEKILHQSGDGEQVV